MALLDEQIDGKYEILEKIREGGMGAIYKVRHRLLDEVRVVKVIRSQADPSSESSDRFLSEARAAIRLRHPNIAVLHDFAVGGDGQAFIVMEMIEGWNLQEVLTGYGPPPLAMTLEIARQSLRALGYLHRHKIVHRDVSPDNLMVTRDVEGHLLVKLIDLGIAKNLEGAGGLTTTGVFLGKPRYGSPERFTGEGWDERSDLYSFGVVFYELLTGRCPVLGNEPAALMAGHLFRPPIPFAETDRKGRVPEELRALILQVLEKKPEARPAKAEAFLAALAEIQARCPLDRGDVETVWAVLQPIAAAHGVNANPAGSTQFRLDQEFGVFQTPIQGIVTVVPALASELAAGRTQVVASPVDSPGESTRRTPVEGVANPDLRVVVPFPETKGEAPTTVEPQDLDATWSRRPLRKEPDAKAKGAATLMEGLPAPPSRDQPGWSGGQGRSARTEGRRRFSFGLAALALFTVAGFGSGGWWLWRDRSLGAGARAGRTAADNAPAVSFPGPPPVTEVPPRAVDDPAFQAPVSVVAVAAEAAPVSFGVNRTGVGARPPVGATVQPRQTLTPEQVGPKFVPPMKLGDPITRDQPGVEEPEIRDLALPVYPLAAQGSGRSATVRVQVLVDQTGRVIQSRVSRPDSSGLGFDDAAREAAWRTLFFPAKRDGIPGQMWTDVDFELRAGQGQR